MKKLLVIPNDPLYRYVEKGEVKERYFNPENYFDEVHVLSLCQADDALDAARLMSGDAARVVIHPVGRPGLLSWRAVKKRALDLARSINPDAVRSYNPLFMGCLAVACARAASAVSVISVHDDYSIARSIGIYGPRFLLTMRGAYQVAQNLLGLNRYMFGRVDHVICAYRFCLRYVGRWRTGEVSVIYNRVDLKKFYPGPVEKRSSPAGNGIRILNVGRQFEGKNPEPLIRALAQMEPPSRLTLV
ncbi:MAG: glycosyltransferase, partial [Gemmatimonadota bacterium]|nr:glycosyltransferase [Gemmatimonadota bacterium]